MNKIDNINKLSRSEFVKLFANIFENASWIAEKLYFKKPFESFENLRLNMLKIFKNTSEENQLKVLNAHPDLANKTMLSSLTQDSLHEQSGAGLDQCSEKEFKEFRDLNTNYKKKFGFPFILAIKGKKKNEIMNEFKKRISNNGDEEFDEAIAQVIKIADFRLNEINIK